MSISETQQSVTILLPVRSSRILLDRYTSEDAEIYWEICNSPEYQRFNAESYVPCQKEDIQNYIRDLSNFDYEKREIPFPLGVRHKETGKLIGFTGFNSGTLKSDGSAEIYYSIHKSCWNKGYATEVLTAMIRFGFENLNLHRIFTGTDIDNFASKRVMEKAGMHFESLWRKDRLRNGRWTDGIGYSILKEDFQSSQLYS